MLGTVFSTIFLIVKNLFLSPVLCSMIKVQKLCRDNLLVWCRSEEILTQCFIIAAWVQQRAFFWLNFHNLSWRYDEGAGSWFMIIVSWQCCISFIIYSLESSITWSIWINQSEIVINWPIRTLRTDQSQFHKLWPITGLSPSLVCRCGAEPRVQRWTLQKRKQCRGESPGCPCWW